MLNIRLADINFCIENKYSYIEKMCEDYLHDGKATLTVSVTEDDIDAEKTEENFDAGYLESLAVYRKIAEKILGYDGFLLHGVVADVEGTGVAFLAKSGVGKSTHANLWQNVLKEKMTIINGDKPLVRIIDGKVFAYGTPWAGKEGLHKNAKVKLSKICFLERSEKNECIKLSQKDVLEKLFPQLYIPKETAKMLAIMDLTEKVIKRCEFYLVRCNTDISAAKVAIEKILESDIEKSLRENKIYVTTTQGDSMYPMLKSGDKVVITAVDGPLEKFDVPVYRQGDHYTMHRIIKVTKSGYVICGDNRTWLEKDITDEDIIGVLLGFYKGGKFIERGSKEFLRYGKIACIKLPLRILKKKILRAFR